MRTWVFASQKGGAGKSTLATQIGVLAQQLGERAAIVDIDPQGSAFAWGKLRGNVMPEAIKALPSDLRRMVADAPGMGYTLLLIDTAPHTRADTVEAIRHADLVICPTKPTLFELDALKDTVAVLELCNRKHMALGVVNGLIPVQQKALLSEYDQATEAMRVMGLRACAQYVCLRKSITDAIAVGKGVTETAPRDKAAVELRNLYDELVNLQPSNVVALKGAANG